jgi:hypothetical protein
MEKRRPIDPVLIPGTLLSVVAGLISYLAGGRDIVLGVAIGLQVEALTLLVQLLVLINDKQTMIGRSGNLISRIESVPWLPAVLDRMAADIIKVEAQYQDTVASISLRRLLSSTEQQLRDLARGHLFVDCYDPSIKLELLKGQVSTLRAMSVAHHDLAWHLSDVGRTYWRAQLDALERGWKIIRIFVYEEWIDELAYLAEEQKRAGVKVKRVIQSDLPPELARLDVTIWGDRHAFEHQATVVGSTTVDLFTVDPLDIDHYKELFSLLEVLAEDI